MKYFCFAFALLAIGRLHAQKDTVFTSIRQEEAPTERQQFADAYQTMFRSQEPVRFLFKWNALAIWPFGSNEINGPSHVVDASAPTSNGLRLDFAVEGKIAPWLSLNVGGGFISGHTSPDLFLYDYIPKGLTYAELRVEPRVYFEMPRRIREGRSANNLSGNYIGLEYGQSELFGQSSEEHLFPERERTATLRLGVQRRIFRYGYFDLSYGVGWRTWEQKYFTGARDEFFANSRVAVGFALATGPRKQAGQTTWCDITRCFREEDRMWRVDLLNALVLNNGREFHGEIPVAYERKIAGSAFSLETEGRLNYGRSHAYAGKNIYYFQNYVGTVGFGIGLEPRYYFNLKKRIARGRSGNNLSGPFVALRVQGRVEHAWTDGDLPIPLNLTNCRFAAMPLFGLQYRILRNGFIAYKAGFGPSVSRDSGKDYRTSWSHDILWLSELKVGLAF